MLAAVFMLGALGADSTAAQEGVSAAYEFDHARALIDEGKTAEAVAVLEGLRAQPDAPRPALALLGALYLQLARPAEAAQVLAPLVEREDADPKVLFDAAQAALAQGESDRVRALLLRSIAKAPVTQATLLLAHLDANDERHDRVVELLEPIVEEPQFAELVAGDQLAADLTLRCARSLVALGRAEPAIEQLRRVSGHYPEDAEVFQLLGQALADVGRLEEARVSLSRARQLEERQRLAVIAQQEVAAQRDQRAQDLVGSATEKYKAGQRGAALELLGEATALAPQYLVARALEIRLLLELDRVVEAGKRADELVGLDAGAESLHLRGLTWLGRGSHAAAEADFRKALADNPDHLAAMNGLALALIEQRRIDEARDVLAGAIERWPNDPVARGMLARLGAADGQ